MDNIITAMETYIHSMIVKAKIEVSFSCRLLLHINTVFITKRFLIKNKVVQNTVRHYDHWDK